MEAWNQVSAVSGFVPQRFSLKSFLQQGLETFRQLSREKVQKAIHTNNVGLIKGLLRDY